MVVRPDLGANFNTNVSTYVVFISVTLTVYWDHGKVNIVMLSAH